MGKKQSRRRKHFYLFFTCLIIVILSSGCAHFSNEINAKPDFEQAEGLTKQGNYKAAADKYEQIISHYPQSGDRALFQAGIVNILPRNKHKNYNKAENCFQRLINKYPKSGYRQQSELFISLINDLESKDKKISKLEQQVEDTENKLSRMKKIDLELKQKRKSFP